MMRARASGCTVACRPQGACRNPETGGARLTMSLKPATCSSTVVHAHRGRGMCCSSTQKSAGPAGQVINRRLRELPEKKPEYELRKRYAREACQLAWVFGAPKICEGARIWCRRNRAKVLVLVPSNAKRCRKMLRTVSYTHLTLPTKA